MLRFFFGRVYNISEAQNPSIPVDYKASLKIPQEYVNRKRTDNTMATR